MHKILACNTLSLSLSLACTPWLWLHSARLHWAWVSIATVKGANTLRAKWEIKADFSCHRHTLKTRSYSSHGKHTANKQTNKQQANDALVQCMVKKYIYWNLCQCRKNWKTGFRFCHSTTGEVLQLSTVSWGPSRWAHQGQYICYWG